MIAGVGVFVWGESERQGFGRGGETGEGGGGAGEAVDRGVAVVGVVYGFQFGVAVEHRDEGIAILLGKKN